MAPKIENNETFLDQPTSEKSSKKEHKLEIVWKNVFLFVILHYYGFQGLYYACVVKLSTVFVAWLIAYISTVCITAGYHRLWTHKTYKAKLPLRIFYMIGSCIAGQNDIYIWARDHRMHHKYVDTDADPHNIQRGFFFAHMGWLMCKKHPDVTEKGKTIDMGDILADPVVRFQRKYYIILMPLFCFVIPTLIAVYIFNEDAYKSFCAMGITRYLFTLHGTWTVNSLAHYVGYQPFDATQRAHDNLFVSFIGMGEGWHNYHHVFPWDYSTSELGYYYNYSKVFIDLMAKIGQAYDLRTATLAQMNRWKNTKGDGKERWYTVSKPQHKD